MLVTFLTVDRKLNPEHAILIIDHINAFDPIATNAVLQAAFEHLPSAFKFVRFRYGLHSNYIFTDPINGAIYKQQLTCGVIQGDPLSSLLFTTALERGLLLEACRRRDTLRFLSYADDVAIVDHRMYSSNSSKPTPPSPLSTFTRK